MKKIFHFAIKFIKGKLPVSIHNKNNIDKEIILKKKLNRKQLGIDFKNSHTIT